GFVRPARPDHGEVGAGGAQHGGGSPIFIAGHEHMPSDVATAERMARGRMRKIAEAFVKARVEMIGNPDLVPGQEVAFEKMGAQLDGTYRIEQARHLFDKHGYFVTFKAVRIAKKAFQGQAQPFQPQPQPNLSNPQWDMQSYPNGAVAKVQVNATNLEGGRVRFIVEQHLGGSAWKPIAEKMATVSQGVAKTTIPIPEAVYLSKPRWTMDTHVDGDEGTMIVEAPGPRTAARSISSSRRRIRKRAIGNRPTRWRRSWRERGRKRQCGLRIRRPDRRPIKSHVTSASGRRSPRINWTTSCAFVPRSSEGAAARGGGVTWQMAERQAARAPGRAQERPRKRNPGGTSFRRR